MISPESPAIDDYIQLGRHNDRPNRRTVFLEQSCKFSPKAIEKWSGPRARGHVFWIICDPKNLLASPYSSIVHHLSKMDALPLTARVWARTRTTQSMLHKTTTEDEEEDLDPDSDVEAEDDKTSKYALKPRPQGSFKCPLKKLGECRRRAQRCKFRKPLPAELSNHTSPLLPALLMKRAKKKLPQASNSIPPYPRPSQASI